MTPSPLPGLAHLKSGKVRDLYAVDDGHLLLVASDRISAFDVVLPTPVPDKGRVLTQLSAWWCRTLLAPEEHQVVTADVDAMPENVRRHANELRGRATLARRTEVFPVECVARAYLSGSGWRDYQATGAICGIELPGGLVESAELPEPIFTPSTKAESGHDEPMTFDEMAALVGADVAEELRARTLALFDRARRHAAERGILIADTKLEFGRSAGGDILVIDEVLTPDSSRFWPAAEYRPGGAQPSYDKQYVRDYLVKSGWNREPPAPELPAEVVSGTRERYLTAYRELTGAEL